MRCQNNHILYGAIWRQIHKVQQIGILKNKELRREQVKKIYKF
jgi:hypothetical protein